MKSTEGGFRDWGFKLASSPEFRGQIVTERESWVLDNADKKAGLSAVDNAKMIEPGYDMMTDAQQKAVVAEVRASARAAIVSSRFQLFHSVCWLVIPMHPSLFFFSSSVVYRFFLSFVCCVLCAG